MSQLLKDWWKEVGVLVGISDQEITNLKRTFTVNSKEIEALEGTFQETLAATNLITSQLFPAQSRPMKAVPRLQRVRTIMENGDCRFHETYVFSGKNHDIHFVEQQIGTMDGEGALFPSDIGFNIASGTAGKDVACLISQNFKTRIHSVA